MRRSHPRQILLPLIALLASTPATTANLTPPEIQRLLWADNYRRKIQDHPVEFLRHWAATFGDRDLSARLSRVTTFDDLKNVVRYLPPVSVNVNVSPAVSVGTDIQAFSSYLIDVVGAGVGAKGIEREVRSTMATSTDLEFYVGLQLYDQRDDPAVSDAYRLSRESVPSLPGTNMSLQSLILDGGSANTLRRIHYASSTDKDLAEAIQQDALPPQTSTATAIENGLKLLQEQTKAQGALLEDMRKKQTEAALTEAETRESLRASAEAHGAVTLASYLIGAVDKRAGLFISTVGNNGLKMIDAGARLVDKAGRLSLAASADMVGAVLAIVSLFQEPATDPFREQVVHMLGDVLSRLDMVSRQLGVIHDDIMAMSDAVSALRQEIAGNATDTRQRLLAISRQIDALAQSERATAKAAFAQPMLQQYERARALREVPALWAAIVKGQFEALARYQDALTDIKRFAVDEITRPPYIDTMTLDADDVESLLEAPPSDLYGLIPPTLAYLQSERPRSQAAVVFRNLSLGYGSAEAFFYRWAPFVVPEHSMAHPDYLAQATRAYLNLALPLPKNRLPHGSSLRALCEVTRSTRRVEETLRSAAAVAHASYQLSVGEFAGAFWEALRHGASSVGLMGAEDAFGYRRRAFATDGGDRVLPYLKQRGLVEETVSGDLGSNLRVPVSGNRFSYGSDYHSYVLIGCAYRVRTFSLTEAAHAVEQRVLAGQEVAQWVEKLCNSEVDHPSDPAFAAVVNDDSHDIDEERMKYDIGVQLRVAVTRPRRDLTPLPESHKGLSGSLEGLREAMVQRTWVGMRQQVTGDLANAGTWLRRAAKQLNKARVAYDVAVRVGVGPCYTASKELVDALHGDWHEQSTAAVMVSERDLLALGDDMDEYAKFLEYIENREGSARLSSLHEVEDVERNCVVGSPGVNETLTLLNGIAAAFDDLLPGGCGAN